MSNSNRHQRKLDERDTDSKPSPRRTGASHQKSDPFASRIPTLTPKNGEKPRLAFTQTRTLTGAFEATAGRSSASDNSKRSSRRYTVEGRERRPSAASPASLPSSPPGELLETYRRIGDAENLAEQVDHDEFNLLPGRDRVERMRNYSPSPGARARDMVEENYAGNTYGSGIVGPDAVADEELRRRLSQRETDDKRLGREREREQPVFSRARMGPKAALSTENLQRRNEEIQKEETQQEPLDQGINPPLNIPRNWGTRGRVTNDWLNRANREVQNDDMADEEEQHLSHDWENDVVDFTSLQVSDSPPVRSGFQYREDVHKPEPAVRPIFSKENIGNSPSKEPEYETQRDDVGKNSPVVIYRNTTYEKPRVVKKEDSQELLRRLARKESPSITNTPEAKVISKTPLNPKTPVVMGAWIDTPLPERTSNPPEETLNITKAPEEMPAGAGPERVEEKVEEKEESPPKMVRRKREPSVKLEKPNLPKSATAAVIEEVKAGKGNLAYGENTLEFLQELLDDTSTSSADSRASKTAEGANPKTLERAKSDGENEEVLIDRLNSKLHSLVQNINEAKAGLISLEDKAAKEAASLASQRSEHSRKNGPHTRKHGVCESCGVHDDGRRYLAIPVPRIWRRHPETRRRQLTRLGWTLIIFFIWQILEVAIDTYRYHPSFLNTPRYMASRNPEWPIAIPHTICRWLHLYSIWRPIRDAMFACVRFVGVSLGMWDPFYDDWMYGVEWYGENWIQRYNPHVYPEFFRREPLVQEQFRPHARWEPGGRGSGGVGVGADPDLSMDADAVLK
ncbi:hypothetical protein PRK78_000573 [Emydomyces testavorans]|uniref:Uncharacterized protein n=1 Tax=Emydomyces testavorans TaxID=2070801 RepID=A0AAF0DBR5_9EURO|nr:hypothetical protein PRK78_000573 [Emydomyces testavorans]